MIPGAVLECSWDAGRSGLVGAEDRVLVAADGYQLAAAPQGPAVGQQRGRAIALEVVQHPTYLPWRQSERSLYCAYTSAAAGCVPTPLSKTLLVPLRAYLVRKLDNAQYSSLLASPRTPGV